MTEIEIIALPDGLDLMSEVQPSLVLLIDTQTNVLGQMTLVSASSRVA